MSKVVIIAPADVDLTDAIKLIKGQGHEVQFEEPTPKTLLHIVLGLMGPNAYGFGPGYAYTPGPEAADDDAAAGGPDPDEEAIEGEATKGEVDGDLDGLPDTDIPPDDFSADDMEFNFEGLSVDGNPVEAVKTDQEHTTLVVEELLVGPKTTYRLNESTYSFWPNDLAMPMQRVDVVRESVRTSLEVEVKRGEKTQLLVGKDLQDLLTPKQAA